MPSESKIAGMAFHSFATGAAILDSPAIGADPVEIACIAPSAVLPMTRAVSEGVVPGAVFDDAQPNNAAIPIRVSRPIESSGFVPDRITAASGGARSKSESRPAQRGPPSRIWQGPAEVL